MWTLESAVPVARELESLLAPGCHVALGGSVLYRGSSEKDLDLFVYSHGTSSPHVEGLLPAIAAQLGCALITALENKGCVTYSDAETRVAEIYVANLPDGRRIDIFFMRKVTR